MWTAMLKGSSPETLELPRGPHSLKVTYRGVTAPVQVIDLPGGNKRFAQFQFGLDSDLPPLKLRDGREVTAYGRGTFSLRDPQSGCPWDLRLTFASIAPCTVEEAYEVADAIERNDLADLREELGDLLLQVVFHSQMASEQRAFGWNDVVAVICDKLVRRNPHVFSDVPVPADGDVHHAWGAAKVAERAGRGRGSVMEENHHELPHKVELENPIHSWGTISYRVALLSDSPVMLVK